MVRYSLRLQQNDNIINIIKSFLSRGIRITAGFLVGNLLIDANCFHIAVHLLIAICAFCISGFHFENAEFFSSYSGDRMVVLIRHCVNT